MKDKPFFSGEDIVYAYTRVNALADGVLCDLSEVAREAGIKYPVALTTAAYQLAIEPPSDCPDQSFQGRAWDILTVFRFAAQRAGDADRIDFTVCIRRDARTWSDVQLKALVHPGDEGELVISIMLPGED